MSEQCIMVSSELVAVWIVFNLILVSQGNGNGKLALTANRDGMRNAILIAQVKECVQWIPLPAHVLMPSLLMCQTPIPIPKIKHSPQYTVILLNDVHAKVFAVNTIHKT